MNLSQESKVYIDELSRVSLWVNEYFSIVLASIGLPGNLLSMFVFLRLIGHKTNMGFLYTCQCVVDFAALLVNFLIIPGSSMLYGFNPMNEYDSVCKLAFFLRRFLFNMSSWMAVITAFDRFLFVIYNQRFKMIRQQKSLVVIIVSTLIVLVLVNIPNFFYSKPSPQQPGCSASQGIKLSSDIVSITFRTYIPLTLMIVFNFMMVRNITKKRAAAASNTNKNANANTRRPRREHLFTVAVISSDFVFFITHIPLSIEYIVNDVYLYAGMLDSNPQAKAQNSLAFYVILQFACVDMMSSIFIYLTFNKLFRREFVRIFFMCQNSIFRKPRTTGSSYLDTNYNNNKHVNTTRHVNGIVASKSHC